MLAAENMFIEEGAIAAINAPFKELYFNYDKIQELFSREKRDLRT
jgi:hypothetical protein